MFFRYHSKRPLILFVLIVVFIMNTCTNDKNPVGPFYANGFALYLLADATIPATKASMEKLDTLTLNEDPLINLAGIKQYSWKDHSFSVTDEVWENVRQVVQSRQSVFGIPFVIVAQNSRRYLGAFWFAYSSIAPTFPHIESIDFLIKDSKPSVLTIQKGWSADVDVRDDPLVYEALKRANKLAE